MPSKPDGLSKHQRAQIERFLHAYADVEAALKKRLRLAASDRTGVGQLIGRYEERVPFWSRQAQQLRALGEIRNVLTHLRSSRSGYPIAVTGDSVALLEDIRNDLMRPEDVAAEFERNVTVVSGGDSLEKVVRMAFENGFSQFPVVEGPRFLGMITETEITRWLGRRAQAGGPNVDLASVTARVLLREKDPWIEKGSIHQFSSLKTPLTEVMGLFSHFPTLEAVLLTKTGGSSAAIEGIVTQWDAARFPGSR